VVRFENVGLRYGMGPEILKDLSFDVPPHTLQFLTGPSGAGKTTLLRLILQTLRPTRGLVTLFGHDTSRLDKDSITRLRRRIGVVFQDFRLLDHLTTYENVSLPLRVQGKDEKVYRPEVVELLKWVGLGDRMHVSPAILSGGEKQRAAIARATISGPNFCWRTSPPAMSIPRWPGGCCACSSR
jgi:cell division transport system ATP-binding protein